MNYSPIVIVIVIVCVIYDVDCIMQKNARMIRYHNTEQCLTVLHSSIYYIRILYNNIR